MMSRPRVVVTGLGVISPLALSVETHFARLNAGESVVEQLVDPAYSNYPRLLVARVHDYDRRELIPDRMLRKLLSPSPAYALAGATAALSDAGLSIGQLKECGLYVGSVCLDANPEAFIPALRESIRDDEVDLSRFATHGMKLVDPLFLVKSLPNAGLCSIAIQHQVLGPNANLTNGTISGLQAVIAAMEALERGDAEFALAGGYDSLLRMDCIVDHLLAGKLVTGDRSPQQACRPFDQNHCGYALSEGSAFLVLETADHAQKRGASSYGELLSFGETAVGRGLIEPQPNAADQLSAAARQALDEAGVKPSAIDAVFVSGLATAWDDAHEAEAYHQTFNGSRPSLTCSTGSFGFTGAATGAFSLVHALLAIRDGVLPPIVNCDTPLDTLDIPFVRTPKSMSVNHAMVCISDSGIKNAALVAARFHP